MGRRRHVDADVEPDADFGDEAAALLRSAAKMLGAEAESRFSVSASALAIMAGRLLGLAADLDRMEIAKTIYAVPHDIQVVDG